MKFALFAATLLGMAMATPVAEAEMQGLEKRMPGCCSGATCWWADGCCCCHWDDDGNYVGRDCHG